MTLLLYLAAICGSVTLFLRSIQVYSYRARLRDEMLALDRAEIEAGGEGWRGDEMRQVSYNRMVYCFWRRPASFYDIDRLRRPRAETP